MIPKLSGATKRDVLKHIREQCSKFWSRGLINYPDFTLHGIEHSENVIGTLGQLIKESTQNFNAVELFLLEAAAYLHDIGMLLDLDSFIEERAKEQWGLTWEDTRRKVITDFCRDPEYADETHKVEKFLADEKLARPKVARDGELVRELHHIFGDHLIRKWARDLQIYEDDEYLYIARISRGHRSVDLASNIYQDTLLRRQHIRVGILAALLRVADETDYSVNRIILSHFEMYQGRLLRSPASLGHWIKHYYIHSAGSVRFESVAGGLKKPVFPVRAVFPRKEFEQLLARYVQKSNEQISTPDVVAHLRKAGLTDPELRLQPEVAGAKYLPDRIAKEMGRIPPEEFVRELEERQMIEEWCRLPELAVMPVSISEEQAITALRFKRLLSSFTNNWFSLEECEFITECEIEVREEISVLWSAVGSTAPLKPISRKPSLENLTQGQKLKLSRRFTNGKRMRWYYLTRDPVQKFTKGERLHYRIRETFANPYLTKKEIREKIRVGDWAFKDPKEHISITTIIPTAKLEMRIIFPEEYRIKKKECKHQARFLETPGVLEDETERTCWEHSQKDRRQILELSVDSPRLFATYYLLWEPQT